MKLGGSPEGLFIAQDIISNKKRFAKLNAEKSPFGRTTLAKRFAIAECAKRKLKCDEEDIRDIAWKVEDYYQYLKKTEP